MEMVLDLCEISYDPGGAAGFKIHSFYHDENTPSCHIYEDHWYDFSNGKGGDQISFVMEFFSTSFGSAMRLMERGVADPMDWERPPMEHKPTAPKVNLLERFETETTDWSDRTRELLRPEIEKRWGLNPFDLQEWGVRIGPNDALWIPHYRTGGQWTETPWINGIKVRDLRTGGKWSVKGSCFTDRLYEWGWKLSQDKRGVMPWIVVEGEPDTWATQRAVAGDVEVFGLPSGASTLKGYWFDHLRGRECYMCLDDDDAGDRASEKLRLLVPGITRIELPWRDDLPDLGEDEGVDCAVAYRNGYNLVRAELGGLVWRKT